MRTCKLQFLHSTKSEESRVKSQDDNLRSQTTHKGPHAIFRPRTCPSLLHLYIKFATRVFPGEYSSGTITRPRLILLATNWPIVDHYPVSAGSFRVQTSDPSQPFIRSCRARSGTYRHDQCKTLYCVLYTINLTGGHQLQERYVSCISVINYPVRRLGVRGRIINMARQVAGADI